MSLQDFAQRTEKVISDHSPTILTTIGAVGALTTAYLTGKATFKAAEILSEAAQSGHYVEPLTAKEKAQIVWKLYIPAVGMGVLTVTAIVFANRIGVRRAAAMAAAYSISERALTEYKDKVVETIGKNKEQKVRDEIAQDRVNKNPVSGQQVIVTGSGDALFYDSITGRYFKSQVETIRRAQNDINESILNGAFGCEALYRFYDLIGLPTTPYSTEVGWNTENLLDVSFSAVTVTTEDGRIQACMSIDYARFPIRNYDSFRH